MKFHGALFICACLMLVSACQLSNRNVTKQGNSELAVLFDRYYNERMELFPLEATANGDNRFNDKLYPDFTDSFREKLKAFYNKYRVYIAQYERDNLNADDQISFDIFKREMQMSLEGLSFHDNYFPSNQFNGVPLTMAQLGSGRSLQPFKTLRDYENWLGRMRAYRVWTDSAILYYKKGIQAGWVLPKNLVQKMIPELEAVARDSSDQNIFFGPIQQLAANPAISPGDKKKLGEACGDAIDHYIRPAYAKLSAFLQNEYLPSARTAAGLNAIPGGDRYYSYLVRFYTTTEKRPEEIYQTGLQEVKRIRGLMDSVKNSAGFKGDLALFFEYLRTGKEFMPYKSPEDVLNAFRDIQGKMQPNLKAMFGRTPKAGFEIRQTEAFRAASASAEYFPGTPDGSRPGIFYVPIVEATRFATTSGMESLFLHEAIPGHHYQISLQQENEKLPKFRRFAQYGAFVEGWALYCESLGRELGLYRDPYHYIGALGKEMHRSLRLVIDVAIHSKNMTREEAIRYMKENEPISETDATAEVERYMAIPGQALSYKIGSLKIQELRNRYQKQLGPRFKLSEFHDELLRDGAMPLEILESKMNAWAARKRG